MKGYADSILVYDLEEQKASRLSSVDYVADFLGGRGLAARLYWEFSEPGHEALDSTNPLIIATGPLAGLTSLAGSRWLICGKVSSSQATNLQL